MNDTMGNPQVTIAEFAWLAGIWDGEGTFGIYRYRQRVSGEWSYCGRLTLSNTSKEMISEIERIFKIMRVKANLWEEKTRRKANHKLAVHITIDKMIDVQKVCEEIKPYIVAKKERVKILLKFIKSRQQYKRIALRDKKGRLMGIKTQGYTKEEISFYDQMKSLNQVGFNDSTSETLRQDPIVGTR